MSSMPISYLFNKDDPDEISSAECFTNALTQPVFSNSSYLTLVDSFNGGNARFSWEERLSVDVYLTGKNHSV